MTNQKTIFLSIVITTLLLLLLGFDTITFHSIKEHQDTTLLERYPPGETIDQGYKYSHQDATITSTPIEVTCTWKKPGEDDGYKLCEATFEIQDFSLEKTTLTTPSVILDFEKPEHIRNINVAYSNTYTLIEKEIPTIIPLETTNPSLTITGQAIKEQEEIGTHPQNQHLKKPRTIKKRPLEQQQKDFHNYFTLPTEIQNEGPIPEKQVIEPEIYHASEKQQENSSEQDTNVETPIITITDEATDNTTSVEIKQNTTPDETNQLALDQISTKESQTTNTQPLTTITGLVAQHLTEEKIDTTKPFAVRITFEVPKYENNNFNFSLQQDNFKVAIDPSISTCPTLTIAGETYSLEQDISSDNTCVRIEEEHITLDCQGHTISFGNNNHQSYGIYVTAPYTTIKNCHFFKDDDFSLADAIYLVQAENSTIINNTFNLTGNYLYGLRIEGSPDTRILENTITTDGEHSLGICLESNNEQITISNNTIATKGLDSLGLFMEDASEITIQNNNLTTYSWESHGLYSLNSHHNYLTYNTLTTHDFDSAAIYLESTGTSRLANNNITTRSSGSHAIYFQNSSNNTLEENNLQTFGASYAYASVEESKQNNLHYNTIETFANEGNGIYLENSETLLAEHNTLSTQGNDSYTIYLYNSHHNIFQHLTMSSIGIDAYGIYFAITSLNNTFQNTTITSTGQRAYALYLANSEHDATFIDSTFNTSYPEETDIYVEPIFTIRPGILQFFNVSYESDYWHESATEVLDIYWYVDINVLTERNTPVSDANITIINTIHTITQKTTNNEGTMTREPLQQLTRTTKENTTHYTNHTITASYQNLNTTQEINLTTNHQLTFFLPIPEEMVVAEEEERTGGGGGSGGGSTKNCKTLWTCTDWEMCKDGKTRRTCTNTLPECTLGETPLLEKGCSSKDKKSLFDVNLELLKTTYTQGTTQLLAKIFLLNIGREGKTEVNLTYTIKNAQDILLIQEKEETILETQIEYLKGIDIQSLTKGTYVLEVNLTYKDQEEPAYAKTIFEITQKQQLTNYWPLFLIITTLTAIPLLRHLYVQHQQKKLLYLIDKDLTTLEKMTELTYEDQRFVSTYEKIRKTYELLLPTSKKEVTTRVQRLLAKKRPVTP